MYGQETNSREIIIEQYSAELKMLLKYLPYLRKMKYNTTANFYEGDGEHHVIQIPVYDSTLLGFVKAASKTTLVYRNYPYVYNRLKLDTVKKELEAMENGKVQDIDLYRAVLSKYVLGGMTKSILWTTAAQEGIFETCLSMLEKHFFEHGSDQFVPRV